MYAYYIVGNDFSHEATRYHRFLFLYNKLSDIFRDIFSTLVELSLMFNFTSKDSANAIYNNDAELF